VTEINHGIDEVLNGVRFGTLKQAKTGNYTAELFLAFTIMIFARQNKAPIKAFTVSLSNQSSTAFGPDSVINGKSSHSDQGSISFCAFIQINLTKLTANHSATILSTGSVVLELSKPTHAKSVRVVFDCKEKDAYKSVSTIFSVESYVWSANGNSQVDIREIPLTIFLNCSCSSLYTCRKTQLWR
jgi:hypothetical protein